MHDVAQLLTDERRRIDFVLILPEPLVGTLCAHLRAPGACFTVRPPSGEPTRRDDWDDAAPVRLVIE
jgi:hypothetical protein